MKRGKNYIDSKKLIESNKLYDSAEAMALAIQTAKSKFDETIELHVKLGVDPRHADQQVRGVVVLPHGTGKTVRVLVIAKGEKADEAAAAGADYVGAEDMIQKITSENWFDFDAVVTTPDMMGLVGRLGKILGPKGLMPNPKSGTVTMDVTRAIHDIKAGKVEYRVDKTAIVDGQLQHRHGGSGQSQARGGKGTVSQERVYRFHDGSQREDPLQDGMTALPRGIRRAERVRAFAPCALKRLTKSLRFATISAFLRQQAAKASMQCLPRSGNNACVFVIPRLGMTIIL